MNPEYFALKFEMGNHDSEIWLALLSEWPFESFHEEENQITGYILQHDITEPMVRFISEHEGVSFEDYELSKVPDKNWNEVWESSFNPVAIDDFCYIRAEFHGNIEDSFKHVVTISPKMAFGTGHHGTTFMMIQAMSEVDFKGKSVFDFGCGTAILSVVAAMEGAAKIIGVDIQPEAIENSYEHAEMNGVSDQCTFYQGGIEKANTEKYDIILANINRNVILDNLSELVSLLHPNGHMLISGIMFDDVPIITSALATESMRILNSSEKDQWVQISAIKE
ncbi:MAG TPA: 50S ribosomal protein L11 methyltransferase [Saprospiraceae bacterium]|nr:50S ribosomal protein L11 methyltransferase [Saprospiraceae bacterium]